MKNQFKSASAKKIKGDMTLQEENDQLKTMIKQYESEFESILQEKLEEAYGELQDFFNEYIQSEYDLVQTLKNDITKLRKQVNSNKMNLTVYEQIVSAVDRLAEMSNQGNDKSDFEKTVQQLRMENSELQKALGQIRYNDHNKFEQLDKEKKDALEKQKQSNDAMVKKLQEEKALLEQQVSAVSTNDTQKLINDMEEMRTRYEMTTKQLQNELQQRPRSGDLKQQNDKIKQLEMINKELNRQVAEAQTEAMKLRGQSGKSPRDDARLHEYEDRVRILENVNKQLTEEVSEQQNEVKRLKSAQNGRGAVLEESEQVKLEVKKIEVEKLTKELKIQKSLVEELQDKVQTITADNEVLRGQIEYMQKDTSFEKRDPPSVILQDHSSPEVSRLREENVQRESQITILHQEISELKAQKANLIKEQAAKDGDLFKLQSQVKAKDLQISRLQTDLDQSRSDLNLSRSNAPHASQSEIVDDRHLKQLQLQFLDIKLVGKQLKSSLADADEQFRRAINGIFRAIPQQSTGLERQKLQHYEELVEQQQQQLQELADHYLLDDSAESFIAFYSERRQPLQNLFIQPDELDSARVNVVKRLKRARRISKSFYASVVAVFQIFKRFFEGQQVSEDFRFAAKLPQTIRAEVQKNYLRYNFNKGIELYLQQVIDQLVEPDKMFSKYREEDHDAFMGLCSVIILFVIEGFEVRDNAAADRGKIIVFPLLTRGAELVLAVQIPEIDTE